jgi:hypothetical protein
MIEATKSPQAKQSGNLPYLNFYRREEILARQSLNLKKPIASSQLRQCLVLFFIRRKPKPCF